MKYRPESLLYLRLATLFAVVLSTLSAAPPDLTTGEIPNEDPAITFNLGPTGLRGWAYHVRADTGDSRQILVTEVDPGSPGDSIMAVGDVILGANGSGANPVAFTSDARKGLAEAIAEAEARNPATLRLLRWRADSISTVSLTLQTLGTYSATAPYNCPKSALILERGLQYVSDNESPGRYYFGAISLLATGNPTYQAQAQTVARSLIPSQATMDRMMSDTRDSNSLITWERGHTLLFLAEYYLATQDAQVLPAIEAYAVNISKNQSLFGTVGHIFAEKNDDGSNNGPMGGVYGVVNSAGMPCFLGVLLARDCGLTNPELTPAIEASSRFFAYYAGKGAIPYGEHEPGARSHESNGKSGLGALYFSLQDDRVEEGQFFAQMATASANERENGHTGAWFNYFWAPLGAAAGGEEAAAAYFSRVSWMLDLNRCWDGRFQYDCLNGEGPNSGSGYNNFRMSTAALLTYALPHRQLRITGKNHDSSRWLTSAEVTAAIEANDYNADSRSDSELISDLENWSPKVRLQAAQELDTRSISTAELDQITAMANDTSAPSHARAGACLALGEIGDASSAAPLSGLLTDADNYVRYSAAEAMRYLPRSANLAVVDTILAAAASTAAPLYPMVEEDPLQFAHGKIATLLFYSGNAYGPKGILWDNLSGIDRSLLYPAIEAVATNPVGFSRSTLSKAYENLTHEDVLALSGTIIDSIVNRAPADKMFSGSIRKGGVIALKKYNIAESVPTCMTYTADEVGGSRVVGLSLLGTFGGSVYSVEPDPDVVGFLESYLSESEVSATAQEALDAIAADLNPTPLAALKSIQSASADFPIMTQPANSNTLRVSGLDYALGDSIYTWRQLSGPSPVTFTPNGTAATESTVQFDGTAGTYEFEVTMSDSRGLTEAYEAVSVVVLEDSGGINDDPAFGFTSPNGGETIYTNTATNITWTPIIGGNVSIDLLKGGVVHSSLISSTPNDGLFEWTVPAGIPDGSDYQIRITSLSNGFVGEGNGVFSIISRLLDDANLSWNTTGDAEWFAQWTTTLDGVDAAQSGDISDNEETSLETTLPSPGTLTFSWKVSSQEDSDYLSLYIDDVLQTGSLERISGEVDWVQKTVIILSPNATVRWTYAKGGSGYLGADAAWVDQVAFTPAETGVAVPNGGETLYPADTTNIYWFSDSGGNVSIDLLKGGALHSNITSSTTNDGVFEWTIPPGIPVGSDYRIRISPLDTSGLTDESDADFTIAEQPLGHAVDALELFWRTTGDSGWFLQSTTTHDGVDAAQSGDIGNDEVTSLETTFARPGTLTFYWKVSSESNRDRLEFYINDVLQTGELASISGEVDWVQKTVDIRQQNTTVRWTYDKSLYHAKGLDSAWLDQVVFTPVEQGVVMPNGGETLYPGNTSNIYWFYESVSDVRIDLLKGGVLHSNITSSTPNDGQFEWVLPTEIIDGTDYRLRISALDGSGIADESDADFTIVLFGTAVDAPELVWITSGDADWLMQSTRTHDGVDGAQSGDIYDNQATSLETTLARPGTLTFYWKVSSELNYDFMEFYINDVLQTDSLAKISGEVDWVQKTVDIPSPNTNIRWTYTKDLSVSSGADAGWLDQVVFTPAPSPFEVWAGPGASPDADTNADGVPAIVAWILGSNDPSQDASSMLPVGDNTSDPDHYIFTYRRSDSAHNDPTTQIVVDYASDLANWNPAIDNGSSVIITETDNFYGAGVDRVQIKINRELIPQDRFFIRLRAEASP